MLDEIGVPCEMVSTTMVAVFEGMTHVCEAPHRWDGGQPPHVPPQPSSPHVLPVHTGVQLDEPPSGPPPEDELVEVPPDEELPVPPPPGPPPEEPAFDPLEGPPELAPAPLEPLEVPRSALGAARWLEVDEQPTAAHQAADARPKMNLRIRANPSEGIVACRRRIGAAIFFPTR